MSTSESTPKLEKVIQIDEEKVQAHLSEIVRGTVEETLNSLLDAEADQLCKARRYERTAGREDTRAGSYTRSLETKAGKVTLKMPKLRKLTFETAIIERYRRRESSVEEALIELKARAATLMRANIAELPDGVYSAEDFLDNGGIVDQPLKIALDITIVISALKTEANISKAEAARVVQIFFDHMADAMARGERVEIRGLCSFFVKEYRSYTGRNPKTGEKVTIKPKKLPFFKSGKELKERVDY